GRRRARRTLGGAGVLVAAGACGSPSAAPTAPANPAAGSAPTAPPAASAPTAQASASATAVPAKRGGTFRWAHYNTFAHLDPHQTSTVATFGYGIGVCYSRLLKFKLRDVELPASIPTGDAAASWE